MSVDSQISVLEQLADEKERFKSDEIYKEIQKMCIKLQRADIIACNNILRKVILDEIITKMKEEDEDYAQLYQTPMFAGSFYKNLKVKKPDEFDLCLMINLCKSIDSKYLEIQPDHEYPSYVKIRVSEEKFRGNERFWNRILTEENYLDQNKFRSWMQGIIDRTFRSFRKRYNGYFIKFKRNPTCESYTLQNHQSGPAFTIHVTKHIKNRATTKIDFDLVPCLVFQNRFLEGFRPRKASQWIAIAKPEESPITWRAGFFNDEKKILSSGDIKPVIRMVKKLRDVYDWKQLRSYFIETLFYHELDDEDFAKNYKDYPRTAVFMYMIRKLQQKIEDGELFDYWHNGFNLLNKINPSELLKIKNKLGKIIHKIDIEIEDNDDVLLDIFEYWDEEEGLF